MNRRELLQIGLGASAAAALPSGAFAQAKFPERPIRLMIPFSAGGVTDIVGRHWAERMKGPLGTIYMERRKSRALRRTATASCSATRA
jgi:tripartite-type tricarboxylate transporter receptor subunit TctC